MKDAAAVGGLSLIAIGAWLINPAAAFLVVGALILIAALVGYYRK